MLSLPRTVLPLLSLNAAGKNRSFRGRHREQVWTVEKNGLVPWNLLQDRIYCQIGFATYLRGWKIPDKPVIPAAAKRFINTLNVISGIHAAEPEWSDLIDTFWCFDISSQTSQAFYQLSTIWVATPKNESPPTHSSPMKLSLHPSAQSQSPRRSDYTLSFGILVFSESVDAVVVKNACRVDRALLNIARMNGVPVLKVE